MPQDVCGWAVAAPPRSVGSSSLEAGGNQSVRHGARSCRLSAFREVVSLCASSTIPSSPASAMVGCAGGFVCTGALWLGGGADTRLAGTKPPYEQGLRALAGELRGVRLRGNESSHGEEAGPWLRIIRQFLERERNSRKLAVASGPPCAAAIAPQRGD